jgi:anti-sigma factor RsiW
MTMSSGHTHIDTAHLVRLLDGQLEREERRSAEGALAECDVCRRSAQRIRERTTRLSAMLLDTDWQPPPAAEALTRIRAAAAQVPAARSSAPGAEAPVRDDRTATRRTRPWTRTAQLRLAAGIAVIVVGAAVIATPAAAWIARAAERAWSIVVGEPAATAPAVQGRAAGDAAQRTYQYVPDAGMLTVHFPAGATGTLHVAGTDGSDLELTASGDDAPGVVLLPSEVRIEAAAGDQDGRYGLTIPRQIDAVRVRVGERAPLLLTKERIGAGLSVELGTVR